MRSSSRAVDAVAPGPEPGLRIGNYELVRRIGKGGMGEVFLARDLTLGRRVAVKFMALDADEMLARRFVIEARATARCTHEHIVVIHEVASWEGLPYMVLEYLDGEPLSALLKRGPLAPGRAIDLLAAVVRALIRAHEAAIIHRDLKPENIHVTRQGVVKVLDFGIAKLVGVHDDDEASRRDLATLEAYDDGRVMGTTPYMAPEQWVNGAIDARTDLFALGVIAYRALAGAHPCGSAQARAIEDAARDVARPYPSLAIAAPHVPEALVAIVDRCVQKRPAARFQTAAELLRALEALDPRGRVRRPDDACPYPGLAGFTEADADRYFGRAREVRRALEVLRTRSLLAVVGHSGSGKSSFALAGVTAALRAADEGWDVIAVRPGAHPLAALAHELRRLPGLGLPADPAAVLAAEPGRLGQWLRAWCRTRRRRVVLVIDQLEEAFTLAPPGPARDAYLAALLAAADDPSEPVRAVVTIRSDFLQAVAGHPALAEAVVEGTLLLTPLDRGGLRAALEGPLELAGFRFDDPAMLDAIVGAFDDEAHALPVLQAVATQLWAHRDRAARVVPRAAIAAIGGVAGALARHANGVVLSLPEDYRDVAQRIFLRLVSARGTRASADRAALEAIDPAAPLVLGALIGARLVVARDDASTIELVHEVLIDGWPLLADWLRSSRDDRAVRERIGHAAAAWDARGRPHGLLWSGDAVVEARRFAERAELELAPVEAAFVRASVTSEHRTRRRRRVLIAAALSVAAAVAVASILALVAVRRAERAATAEARRATAAAASASAAERALAEQVRALEEAERARAAAAAVAAGRQREVETQRAQVQQGEVALRAALAAAEKLIGQRNAALAEERAVRASLEDALARERATVARERDRIRRLEERRSKIVQEMPP